tara:strand:- start:10582 stop:10932 length:351 start_codon:yes stop_codon:yes gene_type:complete
MSYRNLLVWQKAMLLVNKVYKSMEGFPEEELLVLTAQLRKSVISIPKSIAKDNAKQNRNGKSIHSSSTLSALFELQTLLEIALGLNYFRKEIFDNLYEDTREIEKLLKRSALKHVL